MNKQRFIERLNLHLDGELSAEESDELFKAIRRSEEYQRIYVQYCQIFSACSQLGEGLSEERPRSPLRQRVYAMGGLAAAFALLALAAQNLAPVIGFGEQAVATDNLPKSDVTLAVAEPQSTNAVPDKPLMVMNVDDIRGKPVTVNDIELASFDLDAAFDAPQDDRAYQRGVTFVRAKDTSATTSEPVRWHRPFLFDKATPASTFEHEILSSRDTSLSAFGHQQSIASRNAQPGDGEIRFVTPQRIEIFPVKGVDAQVSAATEKK